MIFSLHAACRTLPHHLIPSEAKVVGAWRRRESVPKAFQHAIELSTPHAHAHDAASQGKRDSLMLAAWLGFTPRLTATRPKDIIAAIWLLSSKSQQSTKDSNHLLLRHRYTVTAVGNVIAVVHLQFS